MNSSLEKLLSRYYGFPYAALYDRVRGRVRFGSHSGPTRYRNDSEEAELVTFLSDAASMGFSRSKKAMCCGSSAYLKGPHMITQCN